MLTPEQEALLELKQQLDLEQQYRNEMRRELEELRGRRRITPRVTPYTPYMPLIPGTPLPDPDPEKSIPPVYRGAPGLM
jgi:hypothetical protein